MVFFWGLGFMGSFIHLLWNIVRFWVTLGIQCSSSRGDCCIYVGVSSSPFCINSQTFLDSLNSLLLSLLVFKE